MLRRFGWPFRVKGFDRLPRSCSGLAIESGGVDHSSGASRRSGPIPFEASLPLVVACLLGAVAAFFVWLRVQVRWLLAVAALVTAAGGGCYLPDLLVETDHE